MTYVNPPKLLLLVNGDPNGTGIGEIFLRDLVRFYPPGHLVRFSTVLPGTPEYLGLWCEQRTINYQTPASAWPVVSSIREWQFDLMNRSDAVRRIRHIIHSESIDLIWCLTSSSSMISLIHHLMDQIDIPLATMVWDPPEHFALGQRLDPLYASVLFRRFAEVLRMSARVAVTGSSMQQVFSQRYGVNSIPILHGISPESWHQGSSSPRPSADFIIAFAGSLYAKREWNALLDALEASNSAIANRKVTIRFFGRFPHTRVRKASFVEWMGTLSPQDTLHAISEADVAYLPYWFDRKYSDVVRTSFPSKLSTYLAAGLPIMYHGPEDSSPTRFLASYPVGLCCHSLDANDILETLRRLATDEMVLSTAAAARRAALERELSQDVMLQRFAAFLNVDRCQLLPSSAAAP